jgi:glycogen synthase
LADVAVSLPSDLKKIGHDVRVLLPKYACTKSDNSIQSFDGKTGTGFKFAPNDRKSFQQALQNSMACFSDKPSWNG